MSKTIRSMHAEKQNAEENEENVKCWDELQQLHQSCAGMMASISPLAGVLREKEAIAKCANKRLLVDEAKILSKDLKQYGADLNSVYSQHKHKTGGDADPDSLMVCLQLAEQYYQWMDSFQTVIVPTYESISLNLRGEVLGQYTEVDSQDETPE